MEEDVETNSDSVKLIRQYHNLESNTDWCSSTDNSSLSRENCNGSLGQSLRHVLNIEEMIHNLNEYYRNLEKSDDRMRKTNRIISDLYRISVTAKKKTTSPFSSSESLDIRQLTPPPSTSTSTSSSTSNNNNTNNDGATDGGGGSGDPTNQDKGVEDHKDESGDNLLYQQIQPESETMQLELYNSFCENLQSMVKKISGITVDDLHFNYEQFTLLTAKYGDCRLWENNINFEYQPNVIVMKTYNEYNHKTTSDATNTIEPERTITTPDIEEEEGECPTSSTEPTDIVRVCTEEVFIYPNDITIL